MIHKLVHNNNVNELTLFGTGVPGGRAHQLSVTTLHIYLVCGRGFHLSIPFPAPTIGPMGSTSVSSTTMGILLNEATERPFQTGLLTISLTILGYISFRGLFRNGSDADEETLSKRKYPLPPGPPRDFLIGSLRHFPSSRIWEKFTEWQKLYGDVVHVALPGTSLVILSSYELSQELLSKRTNVTGGRAAGYMVTDIMGLSWSLAFMQPNPHHSNQRKMLRKAIGPARVSSHDPRIEQMTNDLMLEFFNFQGYIPTAVTNAVSKLIIDLTYGEAVREEMGDELTDSNQEIMHLAEYALFNAWIVDFLHFLRFIPSWFPGANFKRIGDRSIKLSDYIRFAPFKVIQELHKSGKLGHSIATDLLGEFGPNEDTQDALAVLNTAGSDTTTAAICAFLHAMFLFPAIADKVFDEIQRVTHGQRLLHIKERGHLPFTEAVWKESMRWNPFIPLGVPHVSSQDEVIDGYWIPKGSMIGQNFGVMLMNPKIWGDPEVFRPERFLNKGDNGMGQGPLNPIDVIFGYGIRICPGMYLASRTGFHIAATTASLFNILPLEGELRPDPSMVEYTDIAFRLPVKLHCRFVPRDERAVHLLKTMLLSK